MSPQRGWYVEGQVQQGYAMPNNGSIYAKTSLMLAPIRLV